MKLTHKLFGGASFALMAFAVAAPAQAQTVPLYSGGGTLAEKVYRDMFNCYGNQAGGDLGVGLVGPQAACNGVAPYRSNVEPLYVGVGSGNGKKAFVNHDASQYTSGSRVPDATPVPSTSDFGPFFGTGTGAGWVAGLAPAFPKVSFTGSDDPLTATDITTYNTVSAGHWGAPIQVPAFITTISVPFNPPTGFTPKNKLLPGGSSLVNLSTNVVCGIFTGAITQWNDPAITADNKNVVLGTGTIKVVVRGDGSGSTFLMTNGLLNQCGLTTHPIPAQWIADNGGSTTTSNNNFFINVNTAGHLPANFTLATGSGGVRNTITANTGAIGYLSPDFVAPIISGGLQTANLQTYASLTLGTKVYKAPSAKNGTTIMSGTFAKAPLFTAGSCPVGTGAGQAADGICAHNPLNWGVVNPTPASAAAYPFGGFTFLDLYTCYASASDKDAVAGKTAGSLGLFTWYFGSPTQNASVVKNQLTANGFSVVPGGWLSGAKKLLTTDLKTAVGTPGQAKTGCTTVTGGA